MARISDVDIVKLVDVDSDIDLDPFIFIANELVTELCTDSEYSDARLKGIEAWLATHFYQVRDQLVKSEKAATVAVTYEGKVGLGLQLTKYGQSAMLFDTAGNLSALSKRMEEGEAASITFTWLGDDYTTTEDD